MKNTVLENILEYAKERLFREYRYCGVAVGDSVAKLNSGRDTNIVISIKEEAK